MKTVTIRLTTRQRDRLLALLFDAKDFRESEMENCYDDERLRKLDAAIAVIDSLTKVLKEAKPV